MLRNSDGTPFKLKGEFITYDPNNKSIDLQNKYDAELIRINGTPIYYYEVIIDTSVVDPEYNEARAKLFNPCYTILWAFYQPPDQVNMSGLFGIDNPDEEVTFELNYKAVKDCLGHIPKIGSRIFTPHRRENWIIIDYKLANFQLWSAFRLILHCRKFQETVTTNNGQVTKNNPC